MDLLIDRALGLLLLLHRQKLHEGLDGHALKREERSGALFRIHLLTRADGAKPALITNSPVCKKEIRRIKNKQVFVLEPI